MASIERDRQMKTKPPAGKRGHQVSARPRTPYPRLSRAHDFLGQLVVDRVQSPLLARASPRQRNANTRIHRLELP